MRVALISPLFESVPPRLYGGTERVVDHLCRGLAEAGIETTLFASGDSATPGELVPVLPRALRLSDPPIDDPHPYDLKLLALVARRASEFDVIHNHHDYWMLPLSEMARTPLLTTVHGRMDLPHIGAAFGSFPRARFVSISESQQRGMPLLAWERTILHGVDAGRFEFKAHPGRYLAFLGRMSREKRPDWAIEIARRSGIPLKMAAKIEGARDREFFEARVRPEIDGRFIDYVGEITEGEKSAFLGDALAMVFPIDWPEPFGLVMLEALACGTPVLARPCGSVPEILRDGVTGFVDPDIGVLARKAADAGRLDRGACRRWVEERFSLKRMTEEYIHVYRRLAALRGTRGRSDRRRRNLLHPLQRLVNRYPQDQFQGQPGLRSRGRAG
jgi:glycosyltransferase involved in cell wall biosynthesis